MNRTNDHIKGGSALSLRFVTGRSGSGKTQYIQNELAEMLKDDPLGKPIIVIVPDQMSFSMEHSLSVDYGLNGIIRAQVLTFKRLAWRILQETSGITRKEVDGFGYRMIVRSVLEENQHAFKLFKRAASKKGFTEQIGDLMKEFSRYSLDIETMTTVKEELKSKKSPQNLIDKVDDLTLLLTKIEEKLGTTYVDSEGHLALLVSQIQYADLIQGAHIYIDGFESFTTREYEIITELMKYGAYVTVSLPMDDDLTMDASHELFSTAVRTCHQLTSIAKAEGVNIEAPHYLTPGKRYKTSSLAHLEYAFDHYPVVPQDGKDAVTFIEAANPRAEIHAVARTIRRLTREGKRYKDIAILYRQPEKYDVLFETIFSHYDIPVFISQKKPMLHHPLIEFSRSILEAITSGWAFEPIFRAVKTDLFIPHGEEKELWRERADRLENYCLARGIYGSRWFDDKRWRVQRYRGLELHKNQQTDEECALEQEIHQVRDLVRTPLKTFEDKFKAANNGRDMAEALFNFMEELHVYDKIIDLRREEELAGRLLGATEHEQAWNEWIQVLDQFVLMFGDKEMDLKEAATILDEGFDSLEFTRIPPSLDQVTVSTIELSSLMNTDVVFVLGVNEGVLPQRVDHEGILSDTDREWFENLGIPLAPTSKMKLMDESYMAYRAFTGAREQLYVSYSLADEEGKSLIPSLYVARIGQVLENCERIQAVLDPEELPEAGHRLEYISHPRATLPFAAMKVKEIEQKIPINTEWQAVLAYYDTDPLWKPIMQQISHPVVEGNKTERLDPTLTEGLYGKSFLTSVSRIESYYSCPFQHFVSFGLKLDERAEYTLEAPDIGDLFHAAIKWVSDEIMSRGKTWAELTTEECWAISRQAVETITPYFFNRILLSTNRYKYIQRKLVHIIQRTIQSMRTQARSSKFHPVAIEAAFGPGEEMPSLEIPLSGGRAMQLRGRIDRIDATEIDGKKYLRVVDYKSSAQDLELAEVYYGLSLQMLTYLDVALEYAEELLGYGADPAGILYMHIHNPMIRTGESLTKGLIEEEILKSHKMRGYLLDRPTVVEAMDEEIGRSSKIIPAALKKDGDFTKASRVLSSEDIQLMRKYVRTRHQMAGNAMLYGDTRVYPYKLKDKMPCEYCAYRSICQFDETDPTQKYRLYEKLTPETSLKKMEEEVASNEHSSETE